MERPDFHSIIYSNNKLDKIKMCFNRKHRNRISSDRLGKEMGRRIGEESELVGQDQEQ